MGRLRRRFCPPEGFRVFVVAIDELYDIGFQVFDGRMDAALQLLAGKFGEPTLDLIDP
jgi:hypothetical protein